MQKLHFGQFNIIIMFLRIWSEKYSKDSQGYQGISSFWHIIQCHKVWSVGTNGITACFPKKLEEENCTVISLSYNISEAKELYVNVKTETRDCPKNILYKCTGKFNLSVHYQITENDFKRVILPNEVPTKNTSFGERWLFYDTNDVSFSVDQKYKSMKLGFQAPFYCGTINDVSVYYYLCPAKTNALIGFPEIIAPSKKLSPYTSAGTCTKNAVKKSNSRYLARQCYYDGTFEVIGGCEFKLDIQRTKTYAKVSGFCILLCKTSIN